MADKPGHFHYAICPTETQIVDDTCQYIGTDRLAILKRQLIEIEVIDTLTAEVFKARQFSGGNQSCPAKIADGSEHLEIVEEVDRDEISVWLDEVYKLSRPPRTTAEALDITIYATREAIKKTDTVLQTNWPIFMQESFDSNDNGWFTGEFSDDTAAITYRIADGTYRWIVVPNSSSNWHREIAELVPVTDFRMSVEMRQATGDKDGSYGIAFRSNAEGTYYFGAIDDGHFVVSSYDSAQGIWSALISETETSAVVPGEPNKLTIHAEGSHFTFLINDQIVAELENDQFAEGVFGLVTGLPDMAGETVFVFDNIELRADDAESLELIRQGLLSAKEGDTEAALAAFKEAQIIDPAYKVSADSWNDLCWQGSL